MIAKIVQGRGFRGALSYILEKVNAKLLYAEGVRLKDKDSIIHSFIVQQKLNPNISKPVAHISLDFSVEDKSRLTDRFMVDVAQDYLKKMGYKDTQYIITRHHDTDHPHIHIVINRIDNNGNRISDQNEKLRNVKICMELTKENGLYIASGKENVKEHRLKEPDKTKYEIYHALQSAISKCLSWQELKIELLKSGITTEFLNNGATDKIQGIRFRKNGYVFNGSKIDRAYSYSKISYQLQRNEKLQQIQINKPKQSTRQYNTTDLSFGLESATTILGGLFDLMKPSPVYDENEVELFQKEAKRRKRKKKNQDKHRL
jgi:hypothetical protein